MTAPTFAATEAAVLAGVSYRQVDHWCKAGLFGEERRELGSGFRRPRFTGGEVLVLAVFGRVSLAIQHAIGDHSGRRRTGGAGVALLAEVAAQVRAGALTVDVELGEGVWLTVDVAELADQRSAIGAPVRPSAPPDPSDDAVAANGDPGAQTAVQRPVRRSLTGGAP